MRSNLLVLAAAAATIGGSLALAPPASALSGCGYAAGYYVKVNSNTSCAFGRNVARAYAKGYRRPRVYSPVTGRYYAMRCYGGTRSGYCSGANRAFVSVRKRY